MKDEDDDFSIDVDVGMLENTGKNQYDELPLDICPLPSQGLLYPADHPLHRIEEVEFKSMTAFEENILATPALIRQGTVLNVLLESSMIDKSIDTESLLMGDKAALLVAIRKSGFGDEYVTITKCPSCGEEGKHEFSLKNVKIKPLGVKPEAIGVNLFSMELPKTKKKIKFSLMTDADDLEVMKIQKARKKSFNSVLVDTTITDRLMTLIKEVDGNKDPNFIRKFINRMPVKDSRAIRRYMSKIEPDLIMKEEVTCRHCGTTTNRNITMGYDFFWPEQSDE